MHKYADATALCPQEIVVGFRKPSGQLTTVQTFQTIQLPRLVRGKPGAWDPSVCLSWGEQFIRFIRSTVTEQMKHSAATTDEGRSQDAERRPLSVWRVKFAPGMGVSMALLDEEGG